MNWYEDPEPGPQIVEYASHDDFQEEAGAAGVRGWRVVSVIESERRAGCMRFLTLGIFALIWKPKPHLLVTYDRRRR